MASVNKAIIVGNLGRDPEVHTFNNGGKIVSARVATTEYWTDRQSGEKRELTEWHTIIFSDRLADVAERYLRKGSSIYVEGKLRTRSWDDKQSGQKRYATEIRADVLQMLGGRPADGQQNDQGYGERQNDYARQSGGGARGYSNNSGGGSYQKTRPAPAPRAVQQEFAEMPDDIPF